MTRKQVQSVTVQWQTLRERERILDGQSHIRYAQLCFHAAVAELYGTVDNALRMDEHLYLISRNAKQPFRLNHLKAFVHQRRRVDGNLRTHIPCGMTQGIGSGDGLDLLIIEQTERAA